MRKYLKWCLLSQAGVAIGLSIMAGKVFPDTLGPTIILVVTATTFIVQILGPVCVKYGITRAGECGLDITEEDLLRESTVADVLAGTASASALCETASFREITECFGRQDALGCSVLSDDGRLAGIISVDNLKESFLLGELTQGLLACDVMNPCPVSCDPSMLVRDARELFALHRIDSIPVVREDGTVLGMVEEHMISRFFNRKVLELHAKVAALETA